MRTSWVNAGLELAWVEDGKAACTGHPLRTRKRQRLQVMKQVQERLDDYLYKVQQLQEWLALANAGKWSETHPSDGEMIDEVVEEEPPAPLQSGDEHLRQIEVKARKLK